MDFAYGMAHRGRDVFLVGLGYGIIQPLIYDKTVDTAIPQKTTLALAFVMVMNYLAILAFSLHHRLFPMDIPYRFARISVYLQSVHNNIDYVLGVCKEKKNSCLVISELVISD